MSGPVAVVGGGLAGIAAALACVDAGRPVTLFEARPHLGGLTHSFVRDGLHVDNGQHVFLRCCTAYRALLDRLGVAGRVHLQPRLEIPIRTPGTAGATWLRRGDLPAPLHLAGSLLRYEPLRPLDRARFALAALALRRVDPADDRTDRQSFGEWLRRHGQSAGAIEALWDLVGVATLNATADEASLSLAATVFQEGLLTDPAAADIGWSLVPLRELHGEPALARLAEAGAEVRTGTKIRELARDGDTWRLRTDAGVEAFGHVVLATPPPVTERLTPAGAIRLPAGWSGGLGSSPIVNVHVVLDRKVLAEPFVAGVRTPVQWVFDRTRQSGLPSGQYLAMSLSAADTEIDLPAATLRERLLPELTGLLPEARDAKVLDFFVTRERHATFRPGPGTASLRPPSVTAAAGLYLAGAWTATGWPATMEGAARSGAAAAAALLEQNVPEKKEGVGA
ncbi:hydroxysqualene dehydroxylase HpnE [Amycolatopsis jiangsuensis]|uniref:Squalene-associated FAD-dependent desaturase n=1 Tax=Amycolatopsis jiangsuensis TaxID=1181879 RepID=A0A840ISU4_9PSEU|nr:hydroxysqualene dehydroxylase HpnE [Amycolatopsis jiangsuensis]MBB4684218.1 squalene-associated FAD-dependent desaturase [Amycolatopsis jiangsuensis]